MLRSYYMFIASKYREEFTVVKESFTQVKNILVAHKKKIGTAIIAVAILGASSVGAHAMFQVRGVVTGVGEHNVTVANFFRTQTVDLTGTPVQVSNIKVGDSVKIQKNLQGDIIYAKVLPAKNGENKEKGKEHYQSKDQKNIEHQRNQDQHQISATSDSTK